MERLKQSTIPDPQQEVIERYCAEARKLLDQACSEEEAIAIGTRMCSRLAQECDSTLILDATQSYVDRMIQTMWKKTTHKENR
jgi:hypothetical protein